MCQQRRDARRFRHEVQPSARPPTSPIPAQLATAPQQAAQRTPPTVPAHPPSEPPPRHRQHLHNSPPPHSRRSERHPQCRRPHPYGGPRSPTPPTPLAATRPAARTEHRPDVGSAAIRTTAHVTGNTGTAHHRTRGTGPGTALSVGRVAGGATARRNRQPDARRPDDDRATDLQRRRVGAERLPTGAFEHPRRTTGELHHPSRRTVVEQCMMQLEQRVGQAD